MKFCVHGLVVVGVEIKNLEINLKIQHNNGIIHLNKTLSAWGILSKQNVVVSSNRNKMRRVTMNELLITVGLILIDIFLLIQIVPHNYLRVSIIPFLRIKSQQAVSFVHQQNSLVNQLIYFTTFCDPNNREGFINIGHSIHPPPPPKKKNIWGPEPKFCLYYLGP